MPLLASLIASLFTSTVAFFAAFITKRLAIIAAVLVIAGTITVAFIGAVQGLIDGLLWAAPTELGLAWGWFIPDNMDNCIAAVIAAELLRWAYDWNVKVLQMKLF